MYIHLQKKLGDLGDEGSRSDIRKVNTQELCNFFYLNCSSTIATSLLRKESEVAVLFLSRQNVSLHFL